MWRGGHVDGLLPRASTSSPAMAVSRPARVSLQNDDGPGRRLALHESPELEHRSKLLQDSKSRERG